MNAGVLVKFKDSYGKERIGKYIGDDEVAVYVREIVQIPVASYSSYDVWKSYKDCVQENWEEFRELWEDELLPVTSDYSTYGDLYDSTTRDKFLGYLSYIGATETFFSLMEGVEASTEDYNQAWENLKECFKDAMEVLMDGKSKYVLVVGYNLNWRGSSGHQQIEWEGDIETVIDKLTPNSDFSLEVYDDKDGELNVRCSHHDVPCGSSMRLVPVDRVVELLSRDGKIAVAKEWFDENDDYEVWIYKNVLKLGESDKDNCVSRNLTKYTEERLNTLVSWMMDETGETDFLIEKYLEELWGTRKYKIKAY